MSCAFCIVVPHSCALLNKIQSFEIESLHFGMYRPLMAIICKILEASNWSKCYILYSDMKEKTYVIVFTLTCDVRSPPPSHAFVGMGTWGGIVPIFVGKLCG